MPDDKFVGIGWEYKYGVNLSINKEKFNELETDDYGNVKLTVGKRKEPDSKSKATHFVKENNYQKSE